MATLTFLPICSKRLSLVFVKTFLVHSFNIAAIVFICVCALNAHINPITMVGKILSQVFSVKFIISATVTIGLQILSCSLSLRLINFKPLVFIRNIDIVAHLLARPLALSGIPILSMAQSVVLYNLLMGFMCHWNTIYYLCSLSGLLALNFVAKMHFTEFGYCSLKMSPKYSYVYIYPTELLLSNLTVFGRLSLFVYSSIALIGRILTVIGFENRNFYLFETEVTLMEKIIAFPVLLTATVMPQLWAKMFVHMFKLWINEPTVNSGPAILEVSKMNQIVSNEMRSENYFIKRNALETLKSVLYISFESRKQIFTVCSRTNDSKLWSEILTEVLANVSELTKSLKKFRFVMKKRKLNEHNVGSNKTRSRNDNSSNFFVPRKLDLDDCSRVGDLSFAHNSSMSFFAPQVADPFLQWDTVNVQQSLINTPRRIGCRPHGSVAGFYDPTSLPNFLYSLNNWLLSTKFVRCLFDSNDSALMASQFDDGKIVGLSLELLRLLLDRAVDEDKHGLVLRDLPQILTEVTALWDAIEQINALG